MREVSVPIAIGLLLMMYPRPVFVAAAVLDFFPIEGTHKTVREVSDLYAKFGHADRIAMREGYHQHQYSPENQDAAIAFLDHFNGLPAGKALPPVKELDEKTLQCTRTGQVMLDYNNAMENFSWVGYQPPQTKVTAELLIKEQLIPKNLETTVVPPSAKSEASSARSSSRSL